MAQHDYINKKPAGRNSKKNAPAKKPFPILLAVIAILLVGGFAYTLWFIKSNADPKLVEKQANPSAPAKVEVVIPRTPEFIKEIRNHEIQVEVKELEQKGPYVMQCGSFQNSCTSGIVKS